MGSSQAQLQATDPLLRTEAPSAPSEGAKPREHLAWLDSLRALAALWVVLHHAFFGLAATWRGTFGHALALILANGQLAVASFIAISGYSLTLPILRNGLRTRGDYKEFVLARWVRIVPPYYLAVFLALALVAVDVVLGKTHLDLAQLRSLAVSVPLHLLLLQDVPARVLLDLPPRWSNGVFWTIGVEFKIYLIFPLMLAIVRKRGFHAAFLATALLAFVLFVLPRQNFTHKASYLFIFLMGVATCYASRARTPRHGILVALASVSAWAGLVLTEPANTVGFTMLLRDLVIGAATCGMMYALSADARLRRLFEPKWLVFIGTYAYSIYLVHVPMIQLFDKLIPSVPRVSPEAGALVKMSISVALALAFARLFYIVCERPFFRKRHRQAEKVLA